MKKQLSNATLAVCQSTFKFSKPFTSGSFGRNEKTQRSYFTFLLISGLLAFYSEVSHAQFSIPLCSTNLQMADVGPAHISCQINCNWTWSGANLTFSNPNGQITNITAPSAGVYPASVSFSGFNPGSNGNPPIPTSGTLNYMLYFIVDADGDGFQFCDDCNDDDALEKPGQVWYKDTDNDGYAQTGAGTITQCPRPSGYKVASELISTTGDCNDNDASIHTNAAELCNGIDDNCDNVVPANEANADNDGYRICQGDCNDNNAAINPATIWYQDADNDGYSNGSTLTQCLQPNGYKLAINLTATSGDCNDSDASIHPNAPETCNGCDKDCDGFTGDGVQPISCGLPAPANCVGQQSCVVQAVPFPGACLPAGGSYTACNNNPQPETCDGIDNNCDGSVDNGIPPIECVPAGTPPGLVYGGTSQCQKGTQECGGTCTGFVGPSEEICDGIDNDCDGTVDEGIGNILYVKANATGLNNGTSWENAFTDLQSALTATCSNITEIWVASGTYKPTIGTDQGISFSMVNGVALYGGFPNTGNPDMAQRDWVTNVTTLSGDIDGDNSLANNSYLVMNNFGLNSSTIIDGITIKGGSGYNGAGMNNNACSHKINNCTFIGNSATFGAGILNLNSSPLLTNCIFSGNSASSGGGIFNWQNSTPTIINCIFSGNSANVGGGIFNDITPATVINCTFSGNTAFVSGSGIYDNNCISTITNCILWGTSNVLTNNSGISNVTYSIVQGDYPGTGNIDKNPLFVDAANGDFHLQACSPAINAGDNAAVPPGITTDLDGNARFYNNGTVDMGAYEYQGTTPAPVAICAANLTIQLDVNHSATVTAAQVGSGSTGCAPFTFLIDDEASQTFDCNTLGSHTVTLKVTDNFLQTATTNCTFTIADDDNPCCEAPEAKCKPFDAILVGNAVTVSASDVDDGSTADCGLQSLIIDVSNFNCSHVGIPQTVKLTITDINNDSDDCTTIVTVLDNEPPTFTCPSNLTVNKDPGQCGAAVTFSLTASDNCTADPMTSSSPPSGCFFPMGGTTVTCMSMDGSGNKSECTFTVTVINTVPLAINCPTEINQVNDTGQCGAVVNYPDATTSDYCPGIAVQQFNYTGSIENWTVPEGVTSITIEAFGAQGGGTYPGASGGRGAYVQGDFSVTPGDQLKILVGEMGQANYGYGGGGGSFVTTVANTPLLVAGGGGGAEHNYYFPGYDAVLTTSGMNVENALGGINGGGGQLGNPNTSGCGWSGSGGGGLIGNGDASGDGGGFSFVNGGAGGTDPSGNCVVGGRGGFGGGGAGGNAGGGGGGYSGGAGGANIGLVPNRGGGGGGSFNGGTNQTNMAGARMGNGYVSISYPLPLIVTQTNGYPSGSIFEVGTITNTFEVSDGLGNTETCSFDITVTDSEDPSPVCKTTTVYLGASGSYSLAQADVFDGGIDNCGTINYQGMSPTSVSCFNIGNTVNVAVTANDGNGNESTCTAHITVEDNIDPMPVCKTTTVYLAANGNYSLAENDVFNGGADNCGTVNFQIMSPTSVSCSNIGNTVNITVTANDGNGNTATCTAHVTVEDASDPTPVCKTTTIQLGANGSYALTENDVFNGGTDNCGTVNFQSMSSTSVTCADEGQTVSVTVTANDGHGNTAQCTAHITVEDNTVPMPVCKTKTVFLGANGSYTLTQNDVFGGGMDNCGTINFWYMSPSTVGCSAEGQVVPVTVHVFDGNGNQATCTASITVEDNTAPVPVCKTTTVQLGANGNHALAQSDVFNGGTDNCGTVNFQSMSPASVSCANVGSTVDVTVTANDGHGNTAQCTASIAVLDNVLPQAKCKAHTVQLDASGNGSLTANDIDNGSSDACGIAGIGLNITSFTCADVGANTVTLTVTDNNNNTNSCQANVTVVDNVLPSANCTAQPIQATLSVNAQYTVDPNSLNNGSTDACGIQSLSASPALLDCQDEGTNTVTLTVTDVNGNTSSCTATVVVAPFITGTSAVSTAESCAGAGNGTVTASATAIGGQMKYSIDGVNFQSSGQFNNLTPGSYTVTFKVYGIPAVCEKTAMVTIGAGGSPTTWYKDIDNDGWSDGVSQYGCVRPANYKASAELDGHISGDCNDNNPLLFPGQTWYKDGDGDGYSNGATQTGCNRPPGYKAASELVQTSGDCNDGNAAVHPGATEICNGLDDDCDGQVDEGTSGGLTYVGNLQFTTQAAVDAFSQCYSVIDGNVTISGAGINDLSNLENLTEVTGNITIQYTGLVDMDGLDNLVEVGGTLTIFFNSSLTTLNGLGSLAAVGGSLMMYYNFQLSDCCAIYSLLDNGGVAGNVVINMNKVGCNSVAQIISNCQPNSSLIGGPSTNQANGQSMDVKDITLYPNPAKGTFSILLSEGFTEGEIKVTDLYGRKIIEKAMEEGLTFYQFDAGSLKPGIYMVVVETPDQHVRAIRLVVD